MVACDSSKCSIKWFHMSCLQMDIPPSREVDMSNLSVEEKT